MGTSKDIVFLIKDPNIEEPYLMTFITSFGCEVGENIDFLDVIGADIIGERIQ